MKRILHETIDGVEHRWCSACKVMQPITEFSASSKEWDGLQHVCKAVRKAEYEKYYDVGVRSAWNRQHLLKTKYHLTVEQFEDKLEAQGGLCTICKVNDAVHIDHDHDCCPGQYSCGKCVRDILCSRCNGGYFGDDIGLMQRKIDYILYWREQQKVV